MVAILGVFNVPPPYNTQNSCERPTFAMLVNKFSSLVGDVLTTASPSAWSFIVEHQGLDIFCQYLSTFTLCNLYVWLPFWLMSMSWYFRLATQWKEHITIRESWRRENTTIRALKLHLSRRPGGHHHMLNGTALNMLFGNWWFTGIFNQLIHS